MRFALMIEAQQGLSYDDQLAIVRRAESVGFESFFRSEHYVSFPGPDDEPTTDAWAVTAGLARDTERIGLGVLMSPVTFRHPGQFAKLVTTVDHMSGGRVEVAVGAGWNDVEHERYGFAFPPIGIRADMLEDQLAVLHGLWGEPDGWSYQGKHVTVRDALFRPKPVAAPGRPSGRDGTPRPRLIVGGGGTPRSARIAARWADEFNLSSSSPDQAQAFFETVTDACRAIDRDPATVTRSVMAGVLVGRDGDEVERRKTDLLEALASDGGDEWFDARTGRWIIGERDAARAGVARFEEAGTQRLMLQDFIPRDLDHIDVMAELLFD
jgi:alkanesulfonate monooxygenase SsuD/methylene tetrahydromethanopterin reductase-like flavin-dependent oxidoreductase (luciferase family)